MGTVVPILQKRKLRCREVTQGQVSEVVGGSQTQVFPALNSALHLHHAAFVSRFLLAIKFGFSNLCPTTYSVLFSFFLNMNSEHRRTSTLPWLKAKLLGCAALLSYPPPRSGSSSHSVHEDLNDCPVVAPSMSYSLNSSSMCSLFLKSLPSTCIVFYTLHKCEYFFHQMDYKLGKKTGLIFLFYFCIAVSKVLGITLVDWLILLNFLVDVRENCFHLSR